MKHSAGFVNIIGNPNVGKSTLMNALLGQKLSIISPKVQTTRHRILGILSEENYQIVFSDTPGILDPGYKLQESMMKSVEGVFQDADIFLMMVEAGQRDFHEGFMQKLTKTDTPVIIIINKIDTTNQDQIVKEIEYWSNKLPDKEIIPVSALHNFNLEKVKQRIVELLPESPPYYDKDSLSDRHERFFIAEIIREKILFNFKQEIPYSVEVEVDAFKEAEDIIRIHAFIYVSRDSQKAIILGHGGKAIKRLGTEARLDIEKFVQKKVFLELTVKVLKDWRNNTGQLKRFGYEE